MQMRHLNLIECDEGAGLAPGVDRVGQRQARPLAENTPHEVQERFLWLASLHPLHNLHHCLDLAK